MERQANLELDSSALTTLALLHRGLNQTIADSGDLNVTQYRVLLKAYERPECARIGDLALSLSLRSNVVTQAADRLQALRLVNRTPHGPDGRSIALVVRSTGIERIHVIDAALTTHLAEILRPLSQVHAAAFRGTIEAAGAGIEGTGTEHLAAVTSTYVTGIAEAFRGVKMVLDQVARTSLSECRTLLNVHEAGDTARISNVAAVLGLPVSTVTRAVDRLVTRSWARRAVGDSDSRTVYIEPTREGLKALETLQEALISYGHWRLYQQLSEEQRAVAYAANRALAKSLLNAQAPHSD